MLRDAIDDNRLQDSCEKNTLHNTKYRRVINICGHKIREARLRMGMDQSNLSFELEDTYGIKLTQSDISEIERRARGIKDFEIVAIAKILNISLEELLSDFSTSYNSAK